MRFFNFLTSRGFAIWLLSLSIGILVIYNQFLQHYSPIFLLIPVFLVLSVSFCTIRRMVAGTWSIRFIGSMVFHAGLLLMIIAGALGTIMSFYATFSLPQGLTVDMNDPQFTETRSGKDLPPMFLKLEKLETIYKDDRFPVDHRAEVLINVMKHGIYEQRRETIRINDPAHVGGYQFLLQFGSFSPRFMLRDVEKGLILDSYINVSNETDKEDTYKIKDAGLTLYTRFFPDVFKEGNKYGTRSPQVKNPAFGIRVVSDKDPFKDLWKGVLKPGDKHEFSGMTLEFADLKPVVNILVSKDSSYWGIFAGWIVIVVGLVIKYLPYARNPRNAQ